MSPAPRPYSHSPSRRRRTGRERPQRRRLGADDVDVAVEDQRAPARRPGGPVGDTLALPSTSQRTARRRLARSAPVERHVDRLEAEAGERAPHHVLAAASAPSSVRRADEVLEQRLHRPASAATASRTAASSGGAAAIEEGLRVGAGGEVRERLAPREARPAVLDAAPRSGSTPAV
jgi:hypothetical protein